MNELKNKAKELSLLIDELIETSKALKQFEHSLNERLNNDEADAHRIFNKEVKRTEQIYRRIGKKINDLGGFEIMQYAYYQVPGPDAVISYSWNGIGEWHH